MERDCLINKVYMECPICDKSHEVEERKRNACTIIKGEKVEYEEVYFFCENADEDENEFVTAKMNSGNLLNARNEYRKKAGLLTSDEIVKIREQYGLSQVDLANLLGWGEATISRYESKAIQDEAYDNMLRIIREDAVMAYEFLQKNRYRFTISKYLEIKDRIIGNMDSNGRERLKRRLLESEYAQYSEPCDANGYQTLNIDKLESIISYFAGKVSELYKVKLMKLLWYADALSFKLRGQSMTGLVYCHENLGALPKGHYRIVDLENVNVEEEEGYEYTRYFFMPSESIGTDCLSKEDIQVLDKVITKFKDYSASDIVKYMHNESAYIRTQAGEVIGFSLAKEIREF